MSVAVWKTQDGRKIAVKNMDDRHLLNTIRMLERNAEAYKQKFLNDGYILEGSLQGEQALYDIGRDIARLEEMTATEFLEELVDSYKAMKWHARRRGLI